MAGEIQFAFSANKTAYALIRNANGLIWSTSGGTGGFEVYNSSDYADYVISVTEQVAGAGYYAGNAPAALTAGTYGMVGKEQLAGSPAQTDPFVATGNFEWNGTAPVPLSNLATSGQLGQFMPMRMARGVMVQNFLFDLVSAADHITPLVSGVVSGQIVRDNGSFGPLQSGAFTEVGLGAYSLQALTSGDLNCNTAMLYFNAVGISGGTSDPRKISLVLQRTSGY